MEDPWHILVLDRHTATERDVKAAYARLLKVHRPDKDPEGFRRVRSAYEQVMNGIGKSPAGNEEQARDVGPQESERAPQAWSSPRMPKRVDQPVSAGWDAALQRLREALGDGRRETIQAAWQSFVRQSRVDRMPMHQEAAALWDVFGGDVSQFADFVTSAWLVRCLEQGLPDIPSALISHWSGCGNTPRLISLAEELVMEMRQVPWEESLGVIQQLVKAMVYWDALLARDVVDLVCELIPEKDAKNLRAAVKGDLAHGRMFQDVPQVHKLFWKQVLGRPDAAAGVDWNSKSAQSALAWVRENRGTSWDGFDLIRSLVPSKEQARMDLAAEKLAHGEKAEWWPIIVPWLGRFAALGVLLLLKACSNWW